MTSSGIVVQKEQSATESAKVHEVISFHQPLSLTPTDTMSVGLNGLLLNGFSPLSLVSSTTVTSTSHPSTPSSMTSSISEDGDWVHISLSPKVGTAVTSKASSSSVSTTQRVRSRFVACRVELACQDKDNLNLWMDTIWQQYDNIRGL